MPGTKIMTEDQNKIRPDFICFHCKLLLRDPMQTCCGHFACSSCVKALLETSSPVCPKDGTELKEEKIFPDRCIKRYLEGILLRCLNPECQWRGKYENREDHINNGCPCVPEEPRLDSDEELEHNGNQQQNQGNEILEVAHQEEPRNNNDGYTRLLLDIFLAIFVRIFAIMSVLRVFKRYVQLVLRFVHLERRVSALESNREVQRQNEVLQLRSCAIELNTELATLREKNENLERNSREMNLAIGRLNESLALKTEKIANLESTHGPVIHNGTFLWKIEGIRRKRLDAINGIQTALYSQPFYSNQFGYKMCAKIYMNGDGFGKGSHLSLFFVVMKGDYDALQTWPFQKKITMMLLDQGNGGHMIDAFHSDPQSSSFQRPKSDMNKASGSPLFMPLDSLSNRQYIKDNVMFIKIIVD